MTECQLPGGIPNESAIEQVQNFLIEKASEQDTAVVLDLMGNFSYRFEQADGNMALPIWLGGKPHLLGSSVANPDPDPQGSTFKSPPGSGSGSRR